MIEANQKIMPESSARKQYLTALVGKNKMNENENKKY